MTTVRRFPSSVVPIRPRSRLGSSSRSYPPGQCHSFSIAKRWQINRYKPSGIVCRLVRMKRAWAADGPSWARWC